MQNQQTLTNKQALRRQLRAKRRSLPSADQRKASQKIAHVTATSLVFMRARTIAFYFANDGEISLLKLLKLALKHRKQCFLPVLHNKHMRFRLFQSTRKLPRNHFGIREPNRYAQTIPPEKIDLVLLPLVGFDRSGARLGMGGGYYDRTFWFKRQNKYRGPKLVGAAHRCQEVNELNTDVWDIPLTAIVTDREWIKAETF